MSGFWIWHGPTEGSGHDPGARVQAAIDILDEVIISAKRGGAAADTLVQRYFTTRRYAGSKDRRAVRELVFGVIRTMGEPPVSGRAGMIGWAKSADPAVLEGFDTGGHAPAALAEGEPEATPNLAPAWQLKLLSGRFGKGTHPAAAALLERAPLDVRVNTLMATRDAVLAELPDFTALPLAPDALRAPEGTQIDSLPAFNQGRIEVQDAGSQIAALAAGAKPGETVIDLCAGAGGKTLALAAAMANRGRLIASDTDRGRLDAMGLRLARAGVTNVERRLLNPNREEDALGDLHRAADRVLVDAPCSGTGTWRRNPEARWRLTPDRLGRLEAEQDRLLVLAATLVRRGGTLTYVVCSLLPDEGEARAEKFLTENNDFISQPFTAGSVTADDGQLVLSPGVNGCDGFFIAMFKRS